MSTIKTPTFRKVTKFSTMNTEEDHYIDKKNPRKKSNEIKVELDEEKLKEKERDRKDKQRAFQSYDDSSYKDNSSKSIVDNPYKERDLHQGDTIISESPSNNQFKNLINQQQSFAHTRESNDLLTQDLNQNSYSIDKPSGKLPQLKVKKKG